MSKRELELDISAMCLRCSVDNKSDQVLYSSEFRFKGGVWKLKYDKRGTNYVLYLRKLSGVQPNPLHISVVVESSGNGRVLSNVRRFTDEFGNESGIAWYRIWDKKEQEILRDVPEFRLYGVLKLLVVLKLEDYASTASQTECSVAKAPEQSRSTKWTSVQTTLLMNALACLESLTNDLSQLVVEGSHHDVEFQCAGHTTKAHKSIVCKRSPVIASMLTTDMVEGRTGVVMIPDMEPDIFTRFMRFIYCGQLEELTFDSALRLYEAGDQYEVLGLAKRCSEFLVDNLSEDNAYEVLVVADAHSNKDFVEKVVDYMVDRRIPRKRDRWSAFSDDHPKLAIKVLNRVWDELVN